MTAWGECASLLGSKAVPWVRERSFCLENKAAFGGTFGKRWWNDSIVMIRIMLFVWCYYSNRSEESKIWGGLGHLSGYPLVTEVSAPSRPWAQFIPPYPCWRRHSNTWHCLWGWGHQLKTMEGALIVVLTALVSWIKHLQEFLLWCNCGSLSAVLGTGLIPHLVQWFKDPSARCSIVHTYGSDLIPGPELHMPQSSQKRKKKFIESWEPFFFMFPLTHSDATPFCLASWAVTPNMDW